MNACSWLGLPTTALVIAALLAIAVFLALAVLVVRWAEHDYDREGRLTARSTLGAWLLYLFHADTVATAAYASALQMDAVTRPLAWTLGATVGGAGLILFVASSITLARALQSGASPLVTTGPYRLMRHPQNLGWTLVLLGIAFAGRSLLALMLVGLFVVFVGRYTRIEEKHLAKRFGVAWQHYLERTPALLSRSSG